MNEIKPRKIFNAYLMLTVFLCGGIVMLIEILCTRVIAPFFGSSIFIWTATITVTLLALAIGYYLGGKVADRSSTPHILYGATFVSGLYLLAILFIKKPILNMCAESGLRMGALLSSALLFGPPLFLLGTISPFAVKLYIRRIEDVGSSVGILYFLSTVGSFFGTIVTGFVLIPQFGVSKILVFASNTLIIISLVYFIGVRRNLKWILFSVVLCADLFVSNQDALSTVMVGNERWKEVYKADSFYGHLKVLESGGINLYLTVDGTTQGTTQADRGLPFSIYHYISDILADAVCPDMKDALVIGLGAGMLPNAFSKRGIVTDVVDIDPKIISVYDRFFSRYGTRERVNIFVEDGRRFIKRCAKKYDVVVLDVFIGDSSPWYLITAEAFSEIRGVLKADGALLINFISEPKDSDAAKILNAIHKTLLEVFPCAYVFNKSGVFGDRAQNVFFLAAFKKPEFSFSQTPPVPAYFVEESDKALKDRRDNPAEGAISLTDDYSPLEFYGAKVKEAWRKEIMRLPERDIMLD